MPLRRFSVRFRDGTSETVRADSLDDAWAKARRSAWKQISVKQQGRKVVADVHVEPGQGPPPAREPKDKCMMRGVSTSGNTRYCQSQRGHKGEHSYANEGM
jgi:hypothetical protein